MIVSTLQKIEPRRRLLWTGRIPLVRATHLWRLDDEGETTRVHTEERFEGLLAQLLAGPLRRMLDSSLERWLHCLKRECERRQSSAVSPR